MPKLSLFAALLLLTSTAFAASYYPLRPNDLNAVYLEHGNFGVHADGIADDSDALQQAIDHVQETTYDGVVFIPEGRYRITKTIHVWEGIRLIGFGAHRPVFVLAKDTPGFQQGTGHYMIQFADRRLPAGQPAEDASEFTFYSGMSNIDFDLEDGNPAAVAIRFHVAQHSALVHMDFHLGSALAALEDIGNQASDLHIYGGQYGILSKKTSPAWQFLLMDSTFEGQSIAAIHTQEVGFTLIRDTFAHTPIAIEIPPNQVEQLYGEDLQMTDISQAALSLGNTKNLRSEVTLEDTSCTSVRNFVQGADPIAVTSKSFIVDHFAIGLDIGPDGRELGIATHHKEHAISHPTPTPITDIPALPPMSTWVDVRTLGVKGDGGTDDTAALQTAINTHRTLFLPSGIYRLTNTLTMKPDTVLIGFNPVTTQLYLPDNTPAFQGTGDAVPLLIAPHTGTNIVTGIGIATGVSNPRATGILWLAGSHSMLEDVTFIPGHSRYIAALSPALPAPAPQPRGSQNIYFDTENPDLWVKDGGGGIFRGLWTHNSFTHAGLRVEDTATPSRIYQLSCEHHLHTEVQFHHAQNWRIYALQTEEENPAGADAIAADIQNSDYLTFANTYMYRVSRNVLPKLYAVTVHSSGNITFDNVKVFSQTRLTFDNSIFDETSGVTVRPHDFSHFTLHRNMQPPAPLPIPTTIFQDTKLTRLATGFSNASGLTSDDQGRIYFTDAAMHKLYRWNASTKTADLLGEIPASPMAAAFVSPSTLLIMAYEKQVFSLDLATPDATPQLVPETPTPTPNTTLLLPIGLHNELWNLNFLLEHRGYIFRQGSNTAIIATVPDEHRGYFYAPNTNTAIIGGGTWRADVQSSQLAPFTIGDQHLIVSEDDATTYRAKLETLQKLTTTVFAQRGGNSVVTDTDGNVYIASGQVYIYNRDGQQIGVLEIPERPSGLAFGGPNHRTLFIGARTSLYAITTTHPGN
jgi:Pectate lyase superfamily protein/SMP-30/Gluconolactonase/LRE-like region